MVQKFAYEDSSRQKQQASVAEGNRSMAVKQEAWGQARVGAEKDA